MGPWIYLFILNKVNTDSLAAGEAFSISLLRPLSGYWYLIGAISC